MFFPAPKGHDQAGAALLFTLGTLTLLLSLGTAFIVNMMAENRQTEDFVRSLQARLAAQAGLERAICELRHAAESNYAAASNQPWFDNSPTQPTQPSYNRAGSSDSGLLGTSARYTLHIIDTASRINLNDANPHLPALLDGLPGLGAALSQRIEDTRNTGMPNGRYAVASQVKWVNGIGDATYNGIENFVTASGYIDPNTMDLVAGTTSTYMASPRSPVNVNTASREVLSAVMEPFMNSAAEADRVADNLITWQQRSTAGTRVMGTWQDYETWRAAVTGLSTAEARNLSDNANPNRKNAWATGAATTPHAKYSTEFCFHSGGMYEIRSVGEALGSTGNPLASVTVTATVPIFKIFNITKKEQFRGEDANFNGVLDAGEDINHNGVLDRPEFRNVTWRDNCPVNSDDDLDIGYRANYDRVNDSLKLGFWEDFDEDESAAFTAAAWVSRSSVTSPGSGYAIQHSDPGGSGNQFHHTSSIPSSSGAYYKSRFGVFELTYNGYRGVDMGGGVAALMWQPGYSFGNAYIHIDVVEDDANLRANPDAGHDDVAWLSFRRAGSADATIYARYTDGIDYYPSGTDEWSASTIYQEPPQGVDMDSAWKADANGNPYNYAWGGITETRKIVEADGSVLPRPLTPGAVVSPAGATRLVARIRFPPRIVFILAASPTSTDPRLPRTGIGDGENGGKFVFGANAATSYTYRPRRTYHVFATNRIVQGIGEVYVPGVYAELAQQDLTGGMIARVRYPEKSTTGYRGEINTYISPEGTLKLANHGSFPSWDNIRIITSVGEYMSPIIDAGSDDIRWGTLAWTVTIPRGHASAQFERVSFEPWRFRDRANAEARYIKDQIIYTNPRQFTDSWPDFRYVDNGDSGGAEPNTVGSGLAFDQTKGRLQVSGSAIVANYPRNWGTGMAPIDAPTLANGVGDPPPPDNTGHRYLIFKTWLTSERYGSMAFPLENPNNDDAHLLRETPVLEDVSVTYIPRTHFHGYREGA